MEPLTPLVARAREGDLEAFGRLVAATQTMAFAAAVSVLRDTGLADLPGQIVELLARPQLTALPENPVGRMLEVIRANYAAMLRYGIDDIRKVDVSNVA